MFCRFAWALRSSAEPARRFGRSHAMLCNSTVSSARDSLSNSDCDITLIFSSIGSGCGHRGLMRTAGALRRAVHPDGPKRERRSAACSTCTGYEPEQLSLLYGWRTRAVDGPEEKIE